MICNDEGHALVASVITYFLEQVRSGKLTGSNASFAPGAKLPVPLTKNAYEDSVRIRNAAAPDMAGLQQIVKAKKELEELGRKRRELHISFE